VKACKKAEIDDTKLAMQPMPTEGEADGGLRYMRYRTRRRWASCPPAMRMVRDAFRGQ
jgi:hypothetical protein